MRRAFDRSLKSLGEILEFVDEFARQHGLGGKTTFAVRLVTEELFANLVRHNKGGEDRIEIGLDMEGGQLTLRLWDYSVEPFDIAGRGPVDVGRPLGERTAGGLGLHFVQRFCDELSYDCAEGNMCVTMTKNLGGTTDV